jgi:predicted esterase YcpF (UPF0227 family)
MKKVLYLHGLESNQGGPKVDFLANEFIVHAPKIDYNDPELNIKMFFTMQDLKPDLIIGSSMGGYVADILAEKYGVPAILFNPALHNRSFDPTIEYPIEGEQADLQERKVVVLGKDDKVIPPYITKLMLENNFNYKIVLEEMGHQTPLSVFIDTINTYKNQL